MTARLHRNAHLVEALGSALRDGDHALGTVPDLLKRVLAEESWREFTTQRGEHVQHEQFTSFVTTRPLKGIGATDELIDRIVGTDDPELLRLLREARSVGQGRRTDLLPLESKPSTRGESSDYTADRLARVAPDQFEAVKRGEKTIHAAALAAGIRRRRASVRLDDPASAARTLRKHMTPDQLHALVRLLMGEAG